MRNFFVLAAVAATQAYANTLVLPPPATASGEQVGIVWIHGASCENQAYTALANEIQSQGAADGKQICVGLPEFILDTPEPILIDHYFDDALEKLREAGFTGDNVWIAGHSLGGVMAQNYAQKHADVIKGQFLMGSVLQRSLRSINEDGTTHFDYPVPTLTLGGTKDGLMRVSRLTEAYWHAHENVEADQTNMFPVFAMEGTSHMSYMTGEAPKLVKKRDLRPDVDDATARSTFAGAVIKFMDNVSTQNFSNWDSSSSHAVMQGLVEAFVMEGSYQMKPPCYGHETENPTLPTCLHGNETTNQFSQPIMGGTFDNPNIVVRNDDNFHRVQSIEPVHLPDVKTTCDKKTTEKCYVDTVTVSENKYDFLDMLDTGYYQVSASEIKTKLSSRQAVQVGAGYQYSDFHEDDEVGNRCAEINQATYDWALKRASPAALANYAKYGQQMVMGDDKGPYNEGPLWIWTFMDYVENDDKTQVTVQSPMMRTPTDYFIGSAAGFHYCKVLSPFKVLEHVYVDSLFERNGIKNDTSYEWGLFLQ